VALYVHPHYVFMAWCLVKHRDNFTQDVDWEGDCNSELRRIRKEATVTQFKVLLQR